MPRALVPQRRVKGLYTHYSPTSGVPEGGLVEARNCVVSRPGVIEPRRGFDRYGDELTTGAKAFLDFKDRLVVHDGDVLRYDSDGIGTWTAWTGNYNAPAGVSKIRSVEARRSLFFTTARGVYASDALTNSPVLAGHVAGLDTETSLSGTGGDWFTPNNQVGYRIVWMRKDENDREIRGAPSYKKVVTNPLTTIAIVHDAVSVATVTHEAHGYMTGDTVEISGATETAYNGTQATITVVDVDTYSFELLGTPTTPESDASAGRALTVDLTFTVPAEAIADESYEIYRTNLSGASSNVTGDEHSLVTKRKLTAAQVTAKVVTYTDELDQAFLGDSLYTNPSLDTIDRENSRPPLAKDIVLYKGHVFYANTKQPHFLEVQLDDLTNISNGDTISIRIGGGTAIDYEFAAAENVANRQFLLSTAELTASQNVAETMRSFVRVINRHTVDANFYAHYSSLEADPPGRVLIRARNFETGKFYMLASDSDVGDSFEQQLPTSGDSVPSSDSEKINGLYRAKFEKPGAVPLGNVDEVGSDDSPIVAILATSDSLIILKEEGVWRLSGEGENAFVIKQLDPTVRIKNANCAVNLNNGVFCLSSQGVLRIDEQGTGLLSWPIEGKIEDIVDFTDSFAVGYEKQHLYVLWVKEVASNAAPRVAWVYNYLTKEWTSWDKKVACGAVLFEDEKMYLGHSEDKFVLQQRNNPSDFGNSDYQDEDIAITVNSSTTSTNDAGATVSFLNVTYTYTGATLRKGFLFKYLSTEARCFNVTSLGSDTYHVELDRDLSGSLPTSNASITGGFFDILALVGIKVASGTSPVTGFAANVAIPIDCQITWAPENAEKSEAKKHFTYAMVTLEEDSAFSHELGFFTDVVAVPEWVDVIELSSNSGWGEFGWGEQPWGATFKKATPLVTAIPRQHQRCQRITMKYRHRAAKEKFSILSTAFYGRVYGGRLVRSPD